MSKTLGSIIAIGAAVAVNVIPGVGQALSGILIGGITAASAVTAVGLAVAASAAGSALMGAPAQRSEMTESSRKAPLPGGSGPRRGEGAGLLP